METCTHSQNVMQVVMSGSGTYFWKNYENGNMVSFLQRKASKFRFILFAIKSSVRHTISQLLLDPLDRCTYVGYETGIKLTVYQISDKLVHQGLRYGVYDGIFGGKSSNLNFKAFLWSEF